MSLKFSASIAAAALAAIGLAPAAAAPASEALRFSHAELLARVAKTANGLATSTLPTGSATAIQVRREKSGEVEIHDAVEDILIAQQGRATIIVGPAKGAQSTGPGEWRGGTIAESHRYELSPGDIVWIPAGLPHQMLLPAGKAFDYLALKFDAKP